MKRLCIAVVMAVWASSVSAADLYVDHAATGSGSGLSWVDAYVSLDDALAIAVDEDAVHIADGTYIPAVPVTEDERSVSFMVPTGVSLRGGYGGETVLSGDGYAYHVVTLVDVIDIILAGLTIAQGNANDSRSRMLDTFGGGLFVQNASVLVQSCVFTDNVASTSWPGIAREGTGGAAAVSRSAVIFDGCTFEGNTAALAGGVLYVAQASAVALVGCSFIDNLSPNGPDWYVRPDSVLAVLEGKKRTRKPR